MKPAKRKEKKMKNLIQTKINDLLMIDAEKTHQILLCNLEFATSGTFTREELENEFFQENDPCDCEDVIFNEEIRNIQHEIINCFSI